MNILLFLQAAQGVGVMAYFPFILILAIMYFLMIRPQAKRQKEKQTMIQALKKGDKVVTSGGITGTISRVIDNDKVEVEIADNVTVEVVRGTGIQSLMNSQEVKK